MSEFALPGDARVETGATRRADKFLTFALGRETLGMEILRIKEIIEYAHVCSVPMVPREVRGVINLRGNVVPVIELAARLGLPAERENKRSCIVIVDVRDEDTTVNLGVVIDSVNKVYEIPGDWIEPPPAFGAKIAAEYISGMGRIQQDFVMLLDLDKVLDIAALADLVGAFNGGGERAA